MIMQRQKSDVEIVNQNIIYTQLQNIIESIRLILTNTYEGEIIHYLANIYTSFIVLEDFYPTLYHEFMKELHIDYKKLKEVTNFFNPNLSSSQRQYLEEVFNLKIKKVVEKLSLVEDFIKNKFL